MSNSMAGRNAVVFGVANKRSIAWAIAQKLSAAGAKLAVTYQNERLAQECREMIAELPGAEGFQCDVSSDAEIDRLFAIGVEQMTERRGETAVETFTTIIDRRPEFAEGWNKRATVLYLMGEYDRSLADCAEVMKRNPPHFGALSGYGMIYLKLGDPGRALGYFERALAVNPNLTQVEQTVEMLRSLLIERRKETI